MTAPRVPDRSVVRFGRRHGSFVTPAVVMLGRVALIVRYTDSRTGDRSHLRSTGSYGHGLASPPRTHLVQSRNAMGTDITIKILQNLQGDVAGLKSDVTE